MIEIHCTCGKSYKVPGEWAGKEARCKSCQRKLTVPSIIQTQLATNLSASNATIMTRKGIMYRVGRLVAKIGPVKSFILFVVFICLAIAMLPRSQDTPSRHQNVKPINKWAKDEALQGKRRALIQEMPSIAQLGVHRIDCRSGGATVWVTPAFHLLSFDDKKLVTKVVYAYTATRAKSKSIVVRVKDYANGKTIYKHSYDGLIPE